MNLFLRKKYKKLYENNIAGVFQSSLNGEMLECNSAFKTILGYRPDDNLFGFDVKQWYKDPSQRERYIEEIVTNGLVNNFELHLKSNNGNDVWLLNNAALLGGHIIQGTVIDITKRKKLSFPQLKVKKSLNGCWNYRPCQPRYIT